MHSGFVEEYIGKPLKKTKFHINSVNEDIGVSFHKQGIVKLLNNIGTVAEITILKYIADNLIAPEIIGKKFNHTLISFT